MQVKRVKANMLKRLLETGFLKAQAASPKYDQWKLAERKARILERNGIFSIAIQIKPKIEPNETLLWLRKATLVMAAYDGAQDCSLQLENEDWLLWRYYDEEIDEKELPQNVVSHLAIAQYLEKGFKKKVETKRNFVMRMRT